MDSRRLGMFIAFGLVAWAAATWIVLRIYRASVETYYRIQGWKTYIVGIAYIGHAILGWWLGDLDPRACTDRVLEGLGAMSLRAGVKKINKPLPAPSSPVADGAESEPP